MRTPEHLGRVKYPGLARLSLSAKLCWYLRVDYGAQGPGFQGTKLNKQITQALIWHATIKDAILGIDRMLKAPF